MEINGTKFCHRKRIGNGRVIEFHQFAFGYNYIWNLWSIPLLLLVFSRWISSFHEISSNQVANKYEKTERFSEEEQVRNERSKRFK